jgi:hypothetical protein
VYIHVCMYVCVCRPESVVTFVSKVLDGLKYVLQNEVCPCTRHFAVCACVLCVCMYVCVCMSSYAD